MTEGLEGAIWKKSSRSGGSSGNCVEWTDLAEGVAVRDSKNPEGGAIVFSRAAREAFTRSLKSGRYDV
jgi:hypothetical protein